MLTKLQIKEIKEHFEKAQNPVFFFDNDPDGLCSFLLLQRWLGRGKGVSVRSFPDLNVQYFRKVHEFNADYIFILDKPVVSGEFFSEAEKHNIPVVWIDHHPIGKNALPASVNYYNPLYNKKKTGEPVTALCYQITNKKDDLWIAVVGCTSDRFLPEYYEDFQEKYPDLSIDTKDPYDILYKSQIGKIARIINFGLKDRTTNVMNMIRFLLKARSPYDVLAENQSNHSFHKRFGQIINIYIRLLKKAISLAEPQKKLLFFKYAGDMSISGELSNELNYLFPDKMVVVAYIKGMEANISVRGKKSRDILLEAIKDIQDSTGGGHENAAGSKMKSKDLERFRENLEKILKQKYIKSAFS